MEKNTISMAIFNSKLLVHQRVHTRMPSLTQSYEVDGILFPSTASHKAHFPLGVPTMVGATKSLVGQQSGLGKIPPSWLVGWAYPSEKWWTNRQLGWWHSIPNCFWKVIQNSCCSSHHQMDFPSTDLSPVELGDLWSIGVFEPTHYVRCRSQVHPEATLRCHSLRPWAMRPPGCRRIQLKLVAKSAQEKTYVSWPHRWLDFPIVSHCPFHTFICWWFMIPSGELT